MPAVLPAPVPTLHHNRDTQACGERRFGSADFWQHLIMVDTDEPRAAPLRGLEEERPLGCLLERKNSIARNFSDLVFEFDQRDAKLVASRIFSMSDKIRIERTRSSQKRSRKERHVSVENASSDDGAGRDGGRCDSVAAGLHARTPTTRHGST